MDHNVSCNAVKEPGQPDSDLDAFLPSLSMTLIL